MKQLRAIRILLATLFFVATLACLIIGPQVHPMAAATPRVQITLSLLSTTSGATLVWLLLSFLFGRIYCSTVCPVGTYQDIFIRLRRFLPERLRSFSYRHRSRWSMHILIVYIFCLVLGVAVVPLILEPWNITSNMAGVINHDALPPQWAVTRAGAVAGVVAGLVSAIVLAIVALLYGRDFCTNICPLGTAMGLMGDRTLMHIEINPDFCSACGKCEEVCRASCIKTLSKYVDNSRCVRCFDCVAVCPDNAIRFQPNRNRPATPLMKRIKQPKS